jgi:hypothetical protein
MSARIDTYRITSDRWGRKWQAEHRDGDSVAWLWCPRAYTRTGALRKAERWLKLGTDIRKHERRYGPNPEARRIRWANR